MYKKYLTYFTLFISLILPIILYAQRSIGEVKAPPTKAVEPNYFDFTVEQYVGKRFIFLQKPKDWQKKGYRFHLDGYYLRKGYNLTPDVNSGHEIFFMLRPALHRIAAHRPPEIGIPTVLAVFADCRKPRCTR